MHLRRCMSPVLNGCSGPQCIKHGNAPENTQQNSVQCLPLRGGGAATYSYE